MKRILLLLFFQIFVSHGFSQTELSSSAGLGGSDGLGCIFKMQQDGSNYTRCYDFSTDFPGFRPWHTKTLDGGK